MTSINERQILQFILKINEDIDNLKLEIGKSLNINSSCNMYAISASFEFNSLIQIP